MVLLLVNLQCPGGRYSWLRVDMPMQQQSLQRNRHVFEADCKHVGRPQQGAYMQSMAVDLLSSQCHLCQPCICAAALACATAGQARACGETGDMFKRVLVESDKWEMARPPNEVRVPTRNA